MGMIFEWMLALERFNSRPISLPHLTECFDAMLQASGNMTRTGFASMADSVDGLWGAAWHHREVLRTLADIELAARAAIRSVELCEELGIFCAWGSTRLPHLLLYCAFKSRDSALVDLVIHKVYTLMTSSPGRPEFRVGMEAHVNEIAPTVHPSAITSLFLNILRSPRTVGFKLYAAIVVASPFLTSKPLLDSDYIAGGDVLGALQDAIKRSHQENDDDTVRTRANAMHAYCDFILLAFKRKQYSDILFSGIYDLFTPLADSLELYSALGGDEVKGDWIHETFLAILTLLQVVHTLPEVASLYYGVIKSEFITKTRESAHARMPALLKAVHDAPQRSSNSCNAVDAWRRTGLCLVEFAMCIGAHPFCAFPTCKYNLRHTPKGVALRKCGGCMNVRYCSTECQKADRKAHKDKCGKNLKA